MPTWTTMTDLATGDLVTEADMDAIRGNIEYLLDPNNDSDVRSAAYSTTSTTFVDIDAGNLSLTVVTNGGSLLVVFSVSAYSSVGPDRFYFDIDVDGTRIGAAGGGVGYIVQGNNNTGFQFASSVTLVALVTGLSAASHTVKPQWRVTTGGVTANITASEGQANLFAIEI